MRGVYQRLRQAASAHEGERSRALFVIPGLRLRRIPE
jgi:hypothetical protein